MKLKSPYEDPYSSLNVVVDKLRDKGYDASFTVIDEKTMEDDKGNTYKPNEVVINEIHRLKSDKEQYRARERLDHTHVVYALSSANGTKGTVVNDFFEGGNDVTDLFLQNVDREDDLP